MAEYDDDGTADALKAKALLDELLPLAKAELSKFRESADETSSSMSTLMRNMLPHLSVDRLSGVHIYPTKTGGWHADVVLSGMPKGIPNVFGTPVEMPCISESAARDAAVYILVSILMAIEDHAENDEKGREGFCAFEYEGVTLSVPQELVDIIAEEADELSREYVLQRLAEIKSELGVTYFTPEVLHEFDQEQMASFQSVLLMALSLDIFRWPERKEGHAGTIH